MPPTFLADGPRRGLGRIRAGFSLSPGVMSAVNSVTFLNF
jgi:hypothetical protein